MFQQWVATVITLALSVSVLGQSNDNRQFLKVALCNVGYDDYQTCEKLVTALREDPVRMKGIEVSAFKEAQYAIELVCERANTLQQCFEMMHTNQQVAVKVPAEELFGVHNVEQYSRFVPVAAVQTHGNCEDDDCHQFSRHYSVIVTRKSANIRKLSDLKDASVCLGPPGDVGKWVIPLHALTSNLTAQSGRQAEEVRRRRQSKYIRQKRQSLSECALDFDDVYRLFSSSCVPGPWVEDQHWKDLYGRKLCGACQDAICPVGDVVPEFCLEALTKGHVDVAFTTSTLVRKYFLVPGSPTERNKRRDYSLLCRHSWKENVYEGNYCHLGVIPEYVYLTNMLNSQGRSDVQVPNLMGAFLKQLYGDINGASRERYPTYLLEFLRGKQHGTIERLDEVYDKSQQPFTKKYLEHEGGGAFLAALGHSLPICARAERLRLCVQSGSEFQKCLTMQSEWSSAGLKGSKLECTIGGSEAGCIRMLNKSEADVAVVASHRADEAIHHQGVIPIFHAEEPADKRHYAVAVTLQRYGVKNLNVIKDPSATISVCSAGTDSFSGWEAPNHAFKQLKIIGRHNCRLTEAWAKTFTSGCVPGAPSTAVTLGRNQSQVIDIRTVQGLCRQCLQGAGGSCQTPGMNKGNNQPANDGVDLYYGDIGALRCLLRSKGQIGFFSDVAIDSIDLLRSLDDQDVRNIRRSDFTLLCDDGKSSMPYSKENVKKCNLGQVPEKWLVARGSATNKMLRAWQDRWLQAANRARKFDDWFRTYPHTRPRQGLHLLDLIFSNTTTSLKRFEIHHDRQHKSTHEEVFGHWEDPFSCGAAGIISSVVAIVFSTLLAAQY